MKTTFTQEELQLLAKQLSCPIGEKGIALADRMNLMNINMTKETIAALAIQNDQHILELGHGNCGHLPFLLEQAANLCYTGLEISETMQQAAQQKNQALLDNKNAIRFKLYDGQKMPFPTSTFDHILSVNNIYFWKEPVDLLKEIHRVLKPTGTFAIAFGKKACMAQYPVTQYGFKLFDKERIKNLVQQTDFKLVALVDKVDKMMNKEGNLVNRQYAVATLQK